MGSILFMMDCSPRDQIECWSNGVMELGIAATFGGQSEYPILQHSSTPSLPDLFLRFRFLDLLQQGEIDEILGLKLFCPWLFFRQKIERSLDTLEGRVGDGPKQRLSDIIAVIQHDRIRGAHILRQYLKGECLVSFDAFDS